MITQQEYLKAKKQIDSAKNKEKLLDDLLTIVEQSEERTTPLERWWLTRGMLTGFLIAKGRTFVDKNGVTHRD